MAVLAKVHVSTLHVCEQLPSVIVDPCLYYCCTAHYALAALCSLCTEGCARTVQLTCVGERNVIREFTYVYAPQLLYSARNFGHIFLKDMYTHTHTHTHTYVHIVSIVRELRHEGAAGTPGVVGGCLPHLRLRI